MRVHALLVLLAVVACDGGAVTRPEAGRVSLAPLAPADMDGVWQGTAGSQPVLLALSWGCPNPYCTIGSDVFVAGGFGTVGSDSVHLTGRLHGDTLHIETARFYGANLPAWTLDAMVTPDVLTGTWTDPHGTAALSLHRLYKGPPH